MEPINYTNQFDFSNPAAINTDPFSNANPTGRPSESVQMADLAAQIPLKPVELPKLSEALVNFSQAPAYESLFNGGMGINLNGGVSLTGRQQGGFRPGDFSTLTDDRMEGTKYNIDQEEAFNNLSTKAWEDWSGFGKVAKFENYIPGTDNEDRLAKQQSGWQMAGRGVEKFLVTASAMVANTVGMVAYGIPHAIQEKSLKALVDNDVSRFLDDMQTTYASEDMIYKSAEYRNKSAVGQVFTGTWWADTAAQGLGYLVGGIATGGAAGAAMKAVGFGGAALGGASRTALGNLSKAALAGDFASIAQKGVVNVFKEAIKKDLASQTLKSATGNLVSLITSAAPEAQIESLGFLKEDAEQYLQAFERSYGRPPTAEETLEYREGARQATNGVFASNLALVGTSNFLQFGDLIGADKVFKKGILDGLINKTFGLGIEKSVIEAGKEGLESATWNVLKRTTAQKVGYHTFKALEKPVTEGLWEEGMQSVIQNTASDYMRSKFDPESMNKSKSAISSFIDGFSHTYGSKEGWQEIIAGMVIGGAGSVRVKGGFDILGQREALNATKQYQSQAENLNETQGNFVAANEKLLQAQENYNALQNESIRNLNARVGSTNQQIANSDKARLEAAKGNLEQAQLYYTNSVFAKLAAEKRADLSDSNKFDMDMMIDNIPEQTLKDMYGFKNQEDIDAFKERTKKTLENQREAFDVSWDFAEQLNPGATASNLMSAQNIQEAAALQFFHGMMAADNANTIARTIEDTVGQGGIASAMNYYANLDSTNQQRVSQINENTEKVKELELKRNQLLDNMTAALSKAVSEVENTSKVNQVDKINADIENLNNQIQQLTDDTNEINNILSNQVNMPKLPFGNPASKFFSGIGLDLADTDVMGAIDSLKALDNYIKDLENTTGKSKQQQSDDFNKAQVLKSMSGMYQNQMKLMRNFAKVANMVSDPSYGNTLYKNIFRKKETKFNNEDWKKNDKAGYDVQNERVLNKTYESLSDEIKKRVDEGKISLFDLHTWETNAQILSMHGRVLQDENITLDLLNSVISTDENGRSVYDKESETGKQLIEDVIDTLISGNTLSEPQKIILSLNLEHITKEVDTRKAEKPSEINDLVEPERNTTLAKEKRFKKIRDEKLAEAERKLQEKQDELFNNGTLDLSKLRNPETQKEGRREEIVEAESLEEGDTIHYDGKDRTIKSITKDLFGVKQMTFTDGTKVLIKDPQPGFPVVKITKIKATSIEEVNEGINEDITIDELENLVKKDYNEEVARIEATYQEALNPTQPDTEQLISAIDEINEVIEKVIQAANDFNLEISTAVIDSFGDQTIPLKEEIKRINQLLNKEELTSEESSELDTLKAKINDYGLLEGRVVYQGQVGPLRLSDLLEQRNQLEKELFVERKSLNNLNLDEIRNITFEQVVETEHEFKEGKSGGDAGVLNSYEFTTFKKVGDNFQIANLKPQGFIEEIGIGNTDVEVTINSQGDVFTIPVGETDYDSQIQPGDKVSVSFTNPEGVSVNISFEVDSSRRINIPISNAEVLNDHTVLSFNTANTIGSSGYYTLTKFDGDNEVYTSSDFDVELDSEATQRLNPGDQISFMYDTEGDDFNKRLEEEYRAALPDPDIQYIIDSVEEYLNDVAGKTKQEREDIYREVSALLGTKVTTKPDALKIVRKLKADNKPVSQEVLDEISMRMKNNMRIVAVDKSGNRVGIVKSIGNSNSAGNGRTKNNHLRTALFEQLKENNFNPKTKSKFSVPVKIVYMGIPNVKSVSGEKVQFNFSEEPGESNINPNKIKSVGYVTYGDMKLQGNKKISTPYNYAKNIMENTLYQGKKIPVVVFDYNGKEVVYPITLIENDGPTLTEQFQDILNQRQSLTLSEFITKANDFLAENGVERNIRLTSLNLNQKLDNVIANLENVPNIPSISELMGTSNFREVLKEKAMIDINLNDKPFIGPKIRFDINTIPETQLNDVSEEVKPTAPQTQSIEEITDNECFD